MAPFNQVTFIGRLGKDPELNVTSEGTPYTRFSLAVDQGKDTPPMWLNVVCWKELAERTTQLLGLWGSHSFVALPHLINPPPFFLLYFVYNLHCPLPCRSPLLVCCIGYTFRVYSLMDTPISAHHVVFLSTPAFSLRFLHTGVRERKP